MSPFAAFAAVVVEAIDLTKYSDLKFAEEYAFSTNREAVIAQLKKEFYEPQYGREPPPDPMVLEDAYFDSVRAKLNSVRAKLPRAVKRKRG